jgi:hypothetical protein
MNYQQPHANVHRDAHLYQGISTIFSLMTKTLILRMFLTLFRLLFHRIAEYEESY